MRLSGVDRTTAFGTRCTRPSDHAPHHRRGDGVGAR